MSPRPTPVSSGKTGLLEPVKARVEALAARFDPFTAVFCTAATSCMIACNQSLAVMMTQQLCQEAEPNPELLAISLENTVILLAPLVPWSIAGAVPLASIGVPTASLLFACYLYLLPLWRLVCSRLRRS